MSNLRGVIWTFSKIKKHFLTPCEMTIYARSSFMRINVNHSISTGGSHKKLYRLKQCKRVCSQDQCNDFRNSSSKCLRCKHFFSLIFVLNHRFTVHTQTFIRSCTFTAMNTSQKVRLGWLDEVIAGVSLSTSTSPPCAIKLQNKSSKMRASMLSR